MQDDKSSDKNEAYAVVKELTPEEKLREEIRYKEKAWRDKLDRLEEWKEHWIKGFIKGFKEGFEIGRQEARQEIVQRMLSRGYPPEEISRITGIPPVDVQKITNEQSDKP